MPFSQRRRRRREGGAGRIDAGERGNVVFAVHASNQDPREFWLYETWTDPDAVEAHESGPAFKAYKDDLRPLVDPDSLVFGDAEPLPSVAMRCPSRTPWRGASSAPWAPTTTRCSTRSTTPTSSSTPRWRGRSAVATRSRPSSRSSTSPTPTCG